MLRRPRLVRFAWWAILSLLALWIGYLVLGNLYLNVRGLEWTIRQATDDADVKLSSAFTWWPGRVIARDLQVLVRTTDVEMDLRIDRVDADIPLLPLFEKEFETRTATVTGVSFRLRKTRPLSELCKQRGVPPIEGMALPASEKNVKCREQIETAKEDRPGPPTPPEELFRIRLNGLALRDVREVWVESYRFTGDARSNGHLRFWPSIELGFSVADLVAEVDLDVGKQKRIDDAGVKGRGRMRLIDLQRAKAETTWRAVSLRAKADAPDLDLALLQQIISGTGPIAPPRMPRISGRAHLMAETELENGAAKLVSLYVEAKQARLKLIERRLIGHARAELLLLPVSQKALGVKKAHVIVKNVTLQNGKERRYGDAVLEVSASGESRLTPSEQKLKIDLTGRSSHSGMLVDLMTTGLPQKIADLVVDDDEPAPFSAELIVDEDVARLEHFSAKADSVRVEGRMRLSPDPGGQMTIHYHGIEITRPL